MVRRLATGALGFLFLLLASPAADGEPGRRAPGKQARTRPLPQGAGPSLLGAAGVMLEGLVMVSLSEP